MVSFVYTWDQNWLTHKLFCSLTTNVNIILKALLDVRSYLQSLWVSPTSYGTVEHSLCKTSAYCQVLCPLFAGIVDENFSETWSMFKTPDISSSSPHLPSENCCEHPCFNAAAGDDTQKMMQAQMMGMGGGLGPDAAKVSERASLVKHSV
jgi:hypothetical protein